MLNSDTKRYIEHYISDKFLALIPPGEPARDAYNSYILHSDSLQGLSDYIDEWIDSDTKNRMFAAARKHISRQKLARNNDGQRETTIKLTPKTRQQLEIFSKQFGLSMTDSLAILARHASEITNQQRLEIYKKYK